MAILNNEFKPIVDWLTYRSYEINRLKSPQVPHYKWRAIYKDAVLFEEIFENYIALQSKGVSNE